MFNFGFNRKTIIIIVVVMAVFWIATAGINGILSVVLLAPAVLIALTFHEFAHGYVAYKLGDETPKLQGRLNLNPIKHLDPIGTIFLVVAGIGWGKPAQIDPRNFNSKYSISKAEAIVAAAGPLMNFIIAFLFTILSFIIIKYTSLIQSLSGDWQYVAVFLLQSVITINIGLGVFNLIPLPPLDGSKVLSHFLPYNARQWFYNNQQIFMIVFLLIWLTPIASNVISPAITGISNGMGWLVYSIFGVF
ncbi:MAG: site-2 protease family protein [Firmicutes bacterium]|nr:site-2 protease family protein [Bacillota bacterium]